MAAVISVLRNDVDVIASFDDAKREAFEAHCARHALIDSKTFISGLSDIVGKAKVSAAHLVAGWLWGCCNRPATDPKTPHEPTDYLHL